MFTLKTSYGERHHIYSYDENKYIFKTYLQNVFDTISLENIDQICEECISKKSEINNDTFNIIFL